jgi:hypothetical protein
MPAVVFNNARCSTMCGPDYPGNMYTQSNHIKERMRHPFISKVGGAPVALFRIDLHFDLGSTNSFLFQNESVTNCLIQRCLHGGRSLDCVLQNEMRHMTE